MGWFRMARARLGYRCFRKEIGWERLVKDRMGRFRLADIGWQGRVFDESQVGWHGLGWDEIRWGGFE